MVDGTEVTYDATDAIARVRQALAGPYAFLVDELGFTPEGDTGSRENRPGHDAWQVLRRGDLTVTLALHGALAPYEPRLEVAPDATVWTLGTAFDLDLAQHVGDPVGLAREVMPLLVAHVDREGIDATTRLVASAAERMRAAADERLRVCDDVEKRWRRLWPDLDVVVGVRDDVSFTRAVRGVATRSGVVAETVLDWREGTATTRLHRGEGSPSRDLRDVLAEIGADDDAASLDRAAGRQDPQLATARLGIRLVHAHWSDLVDHPPRPS